MGQPEKSAQLAFVQRLKESIPPNISLADEMADVLEVSTDSVYRRIRGETAISIDELTKLCAHFKVPFEVGVASADARKTVSFAYTRLSDQLDTFQNYMMSLGAEIARIRSAPDGQLVWSAEDVPIFHHFNYPVLTNFKLFYWSKSILNLPDLDKLPFSPEFIPADIMQLARNTYDQYIAIPTIEIWTEDTLNSTVKQVEYYWESGLFQQKEHALQVLNDIESMIQNLERQAAAGSKIDGDSDSGNFKLYHSDLMVGNNSILVKMAGRKAAYISYNTFNSMVTLNESFCADIEYWLQNLIRKSVLISGVSEKQRYRFFKMKYDKVRKLREKIEKD